MNSLFVGSQDAGFVADVRAAVLACFVHLNVISAPDTAAGADLLVLDVTLPLTELARIIATARQRGGQQPVIFVSPDDTLAARLKAVRSGGAAFFNTPLDTARFAESIREFLRLPDEQPYRALLIDDDPTILALFRHHLVSAGFEVHAVEDALEGYAAAVLFSPDVIFLDISMPAVDGTELLGVLRQQPAFTGTQVVLVSSDTSLTAQLQAMSHGAQNYLVKPVAAHDLVRSAQNNAARARAIRNLVLRDPLTGLFNHGRIHELAEKEFLRYQRSGANYAVVMIDLDRFKQINDVHGHLAGDAALKHFAAHVQRKVRRSDSAGRCGGDEFMLVLPGTDKQSAQSLISKLRAMPLAFAFNGVSIPIAFSCGIADSVGCDHPGAVVSAADAALYETKRTSRSAVAV